MLTRRFASTLVLTFTLCLWALQAQVAQAQDADTEFRNGVAAFEEGRFEEAEGHFRNVLRSKPDHEQALRYREEAGYHFWVRVLARGGRLAVVAKQFIKVAEKQAIHERQDDQRIKEMVRGLWSDDFMEQYETMERLVAEAGHYTVPQLVDVLSDKREDEKRVHALHLLSRMGSEATLALVELLDSGEITLQENVAVALGYTKDVRAVPALMRLAQSTEDPHVRAAAEKSIQSIGGPSGWTTGEYYVRIAEEFYRDNPLLLYNRFSEHVVWRWRSGRLVPSTVPRFRWNEELAEEFCYDALTVEPENESIWTLLVSVYAQEWTEIEESLRVAQMIEDRGEDLDDAEVDQMRDMRRRMAKLKGLVSSRGAGGILSGVGKALADQRAPVAAFLLERLQELDFDTSILSGGGSVTFQPAEEQGSGFRPAPDPEPFRRDPEPVRQPDRTPDTVTEPDPDPVEFEEPDPPVEEPWEPEEPGFEEPEPETSPPPRRRPPKRVSQRAPEVRNRVTKLAYRAPAGVNNADALGAMGTTTEYPTGGAAFSAALAYGDKRVRYGAAIAAAHINPPESFGNSDKVMVNLIDALGESGQRVILVVERDRHTRNRIVGLLREIGYMAFGVENGDVGIVRSRTFPSEDLIVVSSELNHPEEGDPHAIQFIDALQEDYRTAPIKIMVLAPQERTDDMQVLVDEGRAVDQFDREVDRATLADKLTKAFANPADERDEKARSNAIAERAALAIAQLKTGHTIFNIAQASRALAENVKRSAGRPDRVRQACLKGIVAIGAAARPAALSILVGEFKDPTNATPVRVDLAHAIGACVKGAGISGDTFQVLKAALQEEDQGIWDAAFYALGKANLTGPQAREVYQEQRLD